MKPVWAPKGHELFYMTPDGKLMSVLIDTRQGFTPAAPVMLFDASAYSLAGVGRNYDVAPDGQRFIMIKNVAGDENPYPLTVILNWADSLRQRAQAR